MKTVVAAFYADLPYKPSRLYEFLPLIQASKKALELTNPTAIYTVLTDDPTARLIDECDIDLNFIPIVDYDMPLMLKIICAQWLFMRMHRVEDLIILPDVDCIANKDLTKAIPSGVGFATTHRGPKFEYRINNLAYIRDRDLAVWFFERAYEILKGWPIEKHHWDGGDQEAWEASLEKPPDASQWYSYEDLGDDVLRSRPEGRDIFVYPCDTHNCIIPDAGNFQPKHFDAYMVHFKGDRKKHLNRWMDVRFGYDR